MVLSANGLMTPVVFKGLVPFWRRWASGFISFNFKKTFFGSIPNAALNLKWLQ
nr:MAG TPA: hypothetical protein [Caudoviricetes sp.]